MSRSESLQELKSILSEVRPNTCAVIKKSFPEVIRQMLDRPSIEHSTNICCTEEACFAEPLRSGAQHEIEAIPCDVGRTMVHIHSHPPEDEQPGLFSIADYKASVGGTANKCVVDTKDRVIACANTSMLRSDSSLRKKLRFGFKAESDLEDPEKVAATMGWRAIDRIIRAYQEHSRELDNRLIRCIENL